VVDGEMRPGVHHLSEVSWAVGTMRSGLIGVPSIVKTSVTSERKRSEEEKGAPAWSVDAIELLR